MECSSCKHITTSRFIDDDDTFGQVKEYVCRLRSDENGNFGWDSIIEINDCCKEYINNK